MRWRRRRRRWWRRRWWPAGPARAIARAGRPGTWPVWFRTGTRWPETGPARPEIGTHRRAVMHHARAMAVVPVPTAAAEVNTGAEDDGGDEDGSGDDHHPGRGLVEPVRRWRRRRRRSLGGDWRLAHTDQSCPRTTPAAALREGRRPVARGRDGLPAGWGRRGLGAHRWRQLTGSSLVRAGSHRSRAAVVALVKHRVLAVVAVMSMAVVPARTAAADPDSGQEDRRDDEDDAGDDRDPGREPVEPVGLGLTRRCRRRGCGDGCFAHVRHLAGGNTRHR